MLNHQTQKPKRFIHDASYVCVQSWFHCWIKTVCLFAHLILPRKKLRPRAKYFPMKKRQSFRSKMRKANNWILSVFMTRRDSPHRINIWFAFDSIALVMMYQFSCVCFVRYVSMVQAENSLNFNHGAYEYRELCTTLMWKVWFAVEIKFCKYFMYKLIYENFSREFSQQINKIVSTARASIIAFKLHIKR